MPNTRNPDPIRRNLAVLYVLAVGLGIALRYALRDVGTSDTYTYLLPWYEHARLRGWVAVGDNFTNYTPFYSYLLIAVAKLDGLAQPWYLVKFISFVFEFGCAVLAARIVHVCSPGRRAPHLAFAAVWCAPTVLFNGAAWGQSDSIWTFFILLATHQFCLGRRVSGVFAFGTALAVKAQALFFGPLVLGLVLMRKLHWGWLAALPLSYAAVCLPAWFAGIPAQDLATVYLKQGDAFQRLSMNAANFWSLVSNTYYAEGKVLGLLMTAFAGLAFAWRFARLPRELRPETIVHTAALVLLLMPFLLPKMHDRYFYGFELMIIVMACIDRRYASYAIFSQVSGVLAYSVFAGYGTPISLPVAIVINAVLVYALGKNFLAGPRHSAAMPAESVGLANPLRRGSAVAQ